MTADELRQASGVPVATVEAVALAILTEHYKSTSWAWGHGWPNQDRTGKWSCGCGASGPVNQGQRPTTLHRQHVARIIALGVTGGVVAPCADHKPIQHRDGRPPWCPNCQADNKPPSRLGTTP